MREIAIHDLEGGEYLYGVDADIKDWEVNVVIPWLTTRGFSGFGQVVDIPPPNQFAFSRRGVVCIDPSAKKEVLVWW